MKNDKFLAVITPSFNEAESIRVLIKHIFKLYPNCSVYIVDDSSKIENKRTKKYIEKYENVTLISRLSKSGRGSAVIVGLKHALKNKRLKYFIEMDSDLAHDPDEIARFFKKNNEKKYGLIIGSRYLPGGRIVHITKNRTILSRVINSFLRIWLNINVTDFTSGFRLYSREVAEFIVNEKMRSKGFITLSETLYKINKRKFLIGEVPITWNYRIFGKSNVNNIELFTSLIFIIRLRISDLLNNFKFR